MPSKISQTPKDSTAGFHLHKESKTVQQIEADSRMMAAKGWKEGEMGELLMKRV